MDNQRRAGFWRRFISFGLDLLVVAIPFQIIAAALFSLTAGSVQFTHGLTYTNCKNLNQIPQHLSPAPPENANVAIECRVFFLGAETARRLSVRRITKEGSQFVGVGREYTLDANGNPADVRSLEWIEIIVWLVYVVWAKRKGKSFGDYVTKIAIVSLYPDFGSPASVGKLLGRYFLILIPIIFSWVALFLFTVLFARRSSHEIGAVFWTWNLAAYTPAVILYLIYLIQIVRKRDPLYDSVAETAVVLVEAPKIPTVKPIESI